MARKRDLGHISPHHAMASAIKTWFDINDLSGSAISQVYEARLDDVEDDQLALSVALGDEINRAQASEASLSGDITALSSSLSASFDTKLTALSSSLSASFDTKLTALSSSLSASIGQHGHLNVNIPGDAELYFSGDTLLTNANIYISGSGNNLYLHGTNDLGLPAKFEFSISSGSTYISEVSATDFGESVDDPWFKFDGDSLITNADIYVSGSGNYLYLNGTNEQGEYAKYYFDIVSGSVIIVQSGSS